MLYNFELHCNCIKNIHVCSDDTSIRLGDKVVFQALSRTNIPNYYYCFATYNQLEGRKPHPKPLTDYIGRIEKITPIMERAKKEDKESYNTRRRQTVAAIEARKTFCNISGRKWKSESDLESGF